MKLLALLLPLALSAAASAAPVVIANPGFEDLYLGSNLPPQYAGDVPTGAFPTGPPPAGWTAWYETGGPQGGEFLGVLNPGTSADHAPDPACFPAGAPEGDNVVLLYQDGDSGGQEYGVEQDLGVALAARTTYTLTVEVGDIASCAGLVVPYTSFFDLSGFPGYRVQLLAGGVVVAEDDDTLSPGDGVFTPTTLVHHSGTNPSQLGQTLSIRLVTKNQPDVAGVSGLEVDFDDVTLDASPSIGVVPIPPAALLPLGALLLAIGVAASRRA